MEQPPELPGGGVVECSHCHVFNKISSTYCSACENRLPKSAQINLDVMLGNSADKEDLKIAFAEELYNDAIQEFHSGSMKRAEQLLNKAREQHLHPDYSFFYGLCRLSVGDAQGAIKSFDEVKRLQYGQRYPFWPLPMKPSVFNKCLDSLKQDHRQSLEVLFELMRAYNEFYSSAE